MHFCESNPSTVPNSTARDLMACNRTACTVTLPFGLHTLLFVAMLLPVSVRAEDWPMWRHDAHRSASSSESLPNALTLHWSRTYSERRQAWDDPLNLDLMTYDRILEPIVMGGRMFVGFNDADKLVALDAKSGKELWNFYTEGPVRLPPVGWKDRVYFCSDDGFLYCVHAEDGSLAWKFRGAPSSQHAIGNRRLTSAWPARGGPVVRDGKVYFAASIWPFMGTFLYCLEAESGVVEWVNDSTGSQYTKQPHSAPSFAGVAPQGALVATEKELIVPGGRSVPAVFDRSNGKLLYFEINAGGKGTGGSFVAADEKQFFVHTRGKGTRAFDIATGLKTAFTPGEPVLDGNVIYSAEVSSDGTPIVKAYDSKQKTIWQIPVDGTGDLIQAGSHLLAAGKAGITIVVLPKSGELPTFEQQLRTEEPIERLLVADGMLYSVSMSGTIRAFGPGDSNGKGKAESIVQTTSVVPLQVSTDSTLLVEQAFANERTEGFAFWFGKADSPLLEGLASRKGFEQLIVVDSDRERVNALRRKLDQAGLYGRVTVHLSDPLAFKPPSYVGHHVFFEPEREQDIPPETLQAVYAAVRPYGGKLHVLSSKGREALAKVIDRASLEGAEPRTSPYGWVIHRPGALPGSADWTHQYGDIGNTIKSNDRRVKLPLGVLWFGGNSNMDVLPRHGHGPPEQVVGGRLFIQGMNSLSARDVYTGRVLWKRTFEDLGTFDVYFDATYEDTPLDPKYNQVHIPGANGRGTNYVVTDDRVYLLEGNRCHVLDPATGETMLDIVMPGMEEGEAPEWGYIGVYGDVLIGGSGFAKYRERHQLTFDSDKTLTASKAGFGSKSLDRAASAGLVGFDRQTGKVLWKLKPNHSFWHNGIVAGEGKIFCLDKNPTQIEEAMKRRGQSLPDTYRIVAIQSQTGAIEWEVKESVFGTWLGYSGQHGLLLQAGAQASDRLTTEIGQGMAVYRGKDGSVVWKNDKLKYSGPCILHNDWIITNANAYSASAGAYSIQTGNPKLVKNSLTGREQPWTLTRTYGCNSIIASENLLTFRSGAAGFYDLLSDSGTGNLGGFKSGCTSNLVVANGVLNAPDYTRTCSCAYQNQTSLALVHMPDIEQWSVSPILGSAEETRYQELAINFGAPGDRRDNEGRLWMEFPPVAGEAPPLSIATNADARVFQYHSSSMAGVGRPWVLSSGLENIKELRIGSMIDKPFNLKTGLRLIPTRMRWKRRMAK